MKNVIRLLFGIAFWLAFAFAVRLPLLIIGWVVVPFTDPETNPIWGNREHPVPPKWYRPGEKYRDYLWRAWRNPTNNLRYLFEEPSEDEWDLHKGWKNPDNLRQIDSSSTVDKSYRFIIAGIFWEYWYMRAVGDGFFEVRVGWKFSEVPGFGHTLQLRKGE